MVAFDFVPGVLTCNIMQSKMNLEFGSWKPVFLDTATFHLVFLLKTSFCLCIFPLVPGVRCRGVCWQQWLLAMVLG